LISFKFISSKHDDAPDALEGAVQLAKSSAQAGAGIEDQRPWDNIIFGFNMLRLFVTDLSQKTTAMRRHFCPKAMTNENYL